MARPGTAVLIYDHASIKQKYQNRHGVSEKLLNLQDLDKMWVSSFGMVRCGSLMQMSTEAAHGRINSATPCPRNSEPVHSMKTVKNNIFQREIWLYIKAFLCRKPEAKTAAFALIPAYCGFGTFV
jgi:hypothetical protein